MAHSARSKHTLRRCAELVVTAAAHKLDEAWISPQPILSLFYLDQYLPSVRSMVMKYVAL